MYVGSNENFNGDISRWDTSSVNNMNYMFADAVVFNRFISNWNTKVVTDMSNMFENSQVLMEI